MRSGTPLNIDDPELRPSRQAAELAKLRGLTQSEGILLIVLGGLCLAFPLIASAWVSVMVALTFLISGILGWIDNLRSARWQSRAASFWRLVIATLFLLAGVWMLGQFGSGLVPAARQITALASALGIIFLLEGAFATTLALSHRGVAGWRWGLANGLSTAVLGALILTMPPAGLLSVLGLLVGISFLFSGFDLLRFGTRLHLERDEAAVP